MTHRGPFQPLPFCDSVILWSRRSLPTQTILWFYDSIKGHKARHKTGCTAELYNRQIKPSTTGTCSEKPNALDDLCIGGLHGSQRISPHKFQCKISMPCTWCKLDTKLLSGALLPQIRDTAVPQSLTYSEKHKNEVQIRKLWGRTAEEGSR